MTIMDEGALRRRFGQLREADRESAPGFAHTYGRAQARARARQGWRAKLRVGPLVIGAAAAVAIAAVGLAYSRSFSPPAVTPEIVTWRAPTDTLLRAPGSELLGEMPALGASVLDKMIPKHPETGA